MEVLRLSESCAEIALGWIFLGRNIMVDRFTNHWILFSRSYWGRGKDGRDKVYDRMEV